MARETPEAHIPEVGGVPVSITSTESSPLVIQAGPQTMFFDHKEARLLRAKLNSIDLRDSPRKGGAALSPTDG